MNAPPLVRAEPSAALLGATRAWLEPVRGALGQEFLAAYLRTASRLTSIRCS